MRRPTSMRLICYICNYRGSHRLRAEHETVVVRAPKRTRIVGPPGR